MCVSVCTPVLMWAKLAGRDDVIVQLCVYTDMLETFLWSYKHDCVLRRVCDGGAFLGFSDPAVYLCQPSHPLVYLC